MSKGVDKMQSTEEIPCFVGITFSFGQPNSFTILVSCVEEEIVEEEE